jgi:hypothetical protein
MFSEGLATRLPDRHTGGSGGPGGLGLGIVHAGAFHGLPRMEDAEMFYLQEEEREWENK